MSDESTTIVVPPSRPRRWVTLVLCTIIFLAGGVVGWGLTVCRQQEEEWPRPQKTFEQRRDRFTDRIAGKLDLTPEQTDELREIVGRRIRAFEAIREKILPEMKAQHEALDRELRPLLNEEQAKRWDELYAELNQRWFQSSPKGEDKDGGSIKNPSPSGGV
jgi:hypothetical protein